jgi:PII-like signaling protein
MNDSAPIEGVYLRFFVHENRRHGSMLLYEWLLAEAKKQGLPGGTAFRSIAGYGRHGVTHEAHFLELAGQETVRVDFVVPRDAADRMLQRVRDEHIEMFYAILPATFGKLETRKP